MAKQVSVTSTKKEILDAYNQMIEQIAKKDDEPVKEQTKSKTEKIIQEVGSLSVELIIQNIAGLKTSITGALDKLENQMVTSFKELQKVQETIHVEKDNLAEMYNITANAHSLAALIAAQKEKKEAFEKEIETTSLMWESEKKLFEKESKENKELGNKERKREEEEYLYELKLKRKKEQDIYEEKKNQQEKELAGKKTAFEKEIIEREIKLKDSEAELAELRKKSTEFPKLLESEVSKAIKLTTENLKLQFDFEKQLNNAKENGESVLKDQIIESLKEKIKDQETLIKQLTQKVNVSEDSVKQIALKALDSSSKERVITHEKQTEKKD
jgi:hypothetical protein